MNIQETHTLVSCSDSVAVVSVISEECPAVWIPLAVVPQVSMCPFSWQYMESLLEPSFQTLQELQGSHHHSEARIRGGKTGLDGESLEFQHLG